MDYLILICLVWSVAALWQWYAWYLPRAQGRVSNAGISPPVSVIVCVHDNVPALQKLLAALSDQSYKAYEIVIVNDGPNTYVADFLASVPDRDRLRIVTYDASQKTIAGKKAPLAAGIHAARYDWLLLTDADCVPSNNWIETMMRCTPAESGIVLGIAPFFKARGLRNLLQRFDGLVVAVQYAGAALRGWPYMGVGRNLMYHRSLFTGFDRHLHLVSGDDDLFVQSVATASNTTVCLDRSSFVYSDAPATWADWLFQKRRHVSTGRSYTFRAKAFTSVFAITFLLAWLLLPWVMMQGTWLYVGIVFVTVQWLLFWRAVQRLAQPGLRLFFPLLVYGYCIVLFLFPIFLILRPPQAWNRS